MDEIEHLKGQLDKHELREEKQWAAIAGKLDDIVRLNEKIVLLQERQATHAADLKELNQSYEKSHEHLHLRLNSDASDIRKLQDGLTALLQEVSIAKKIITALWGVVGSSLVMGFLKLYN